VKVVKMGRAGAMLKLEILMPDVSNELFVSIKGHYTGFPSGGVPQSDQDFEIFVERDAPILRDGTCSVRKIVARLIAYYLSRYL